MIPQIRVMNYLKRIFICHLVFLAFVSSSLAGTLYVGQKESNSVNSYSSIMAAVSKAESGDKIVIYPGQYNEMIIINKGLSIVGDGSGEVVLSGNKASGYSTICQISNASGCVIENVTFAPCVLQISSKTSLLTVDSSQATIKNCVFRNSSDSGIRARGSNTNLDVSNCKFETNVGCGIYILDVGSAVISKCVVTKNGDGILAEKAGDLQLSENLVTGNKINGIFISEVQQSKLSANESNQNGLHGIYVKDGNKCELKGNKCSNNIKSGFYLTGQELVVAMDGNSSKSNNKEGIHAAFGTTGVISNNTSSENKQRGIYCQSSDVTLDSNICQANSYSGIYLSQGSMGNVKNNTSKLNLFGITVKDSYSAPSLISNVCTENRSRNLYIISSIVGRVREKVLAKEFDKLEQLIGNWRKEGKRDKDGRWYSSRFYQMLWGFSEFLSDKNQEKYFGAVKQWCAEKPDSVAPRIFLAGLYTRRAWGHRGGGFADTVTDEGWKKFRENLNIAMEILEDAEKLEEKDAELYCVFLSCGLGLSKPRVWMEDKFRKGTEIQKDYHHLYNAMILSLQPKWGGSIKQVVDFTEEIYKLESKEGGKSTYARVASKMLFANSTEYFLSLGLPYDKIKEGFKSLLRIYPKSKLNINRLCYFACLHRDREMARKLFKLLKKQHIVLSVWKHNTEYIERSRKWALSEDQEQDKD